jgi:PmbA protein
VIKAGTTDAKQLYSGTVFKVIGLKGLHSGTNAISGHFSLAAEGMLMKDGEIQQYVKDVTLSGNFYQLLEQILAVGQTVEASSGLTFFSPDIRFEGLSVAGA